MFTEAITITSESVASVPFSQEVNSLSQIIDAILASLDVVTASIDVPQTVETTIDTVSRFHGTGGALIVSLIAFTIVFSVLAALSATIFVNRYIAMIVGKKDKPATPSAPAPQAVSAPVSQAASDDLDMKKVVAAISAAICASTGRRMNVISVARVPLAHGNCPSLTPIWRATGIAECMESRLGSRSW
ncbi:MAG: OadG family protein [Synergistaceae bacterium]|nr:OadG family protein [Synergistaceae bacterium]